MTTFAQIPTVYKDNANMAATRDRHAHADLVLDVAVKAAVVSIRSGRTDYARGQLETAGERAARVLGPTDWATRAGAR